MTEANALGAKVDATINHSLKRIHDVSHENIMPNTDAKFTSNQLVPALLLDLLTFRATQRPNTELS